MNRLTKLLILALLAGCCSCQDNAALDAADTLAMTDPGEAIAILDSMSVRQLTDGQAARHALLTAKAKLKAHIVPAGDSAISRAAAYYRGRGDSLEVQSLYYLGAVRSATGLYDKALLSLHEAYDKARQSDDIFYSAMSAREISNVYANLLVVGKELEWALTAQELFRQASKSVHASWMEPAIIEALTYSGQTEKALERCQKFKLSSDDNDALHTAVKLREVEALATDHRYYEVMELYDKLEQAGYIPDSHDNCLLSESFLAVGKADSAALYLEAAQQLPMSREDSLYVLKIGHSLNALAGNFPKAYTEAAELAGKIMDVDRIRLANPQTMLLTENLKLQLDNERILARSNRMQHIWTISLIIAITIVLLFASLYFRARYHGKMLEADRFIAEIISLREDLEFSRKCRKEAETESSAIIESDERLKKELSAKNEQLRDMTRKHNDSDTQHRAEITQMKAQIEQHFYEEIRHVFSRHVALMDQICFVWFKNSESADESRSYNDVISLIKRFQDIIVVEELAELIDRYNDGWMSKFRTAYPDLNNKECLLSMYLYIGLKTESIAALLGKKNTKAVFTSKYKLKIKLMSNPAYEELKVNEVLKMPVSKS